MQVAHLFVLLSLFVGERCLASDSSQGVNPISKVLDLLKDLTDKVSEDGHSEDIAYTKYANWCRNEAQELGFTIETAKKKRAELEAKIDEMDGDITSCTSEIEDLASSISSNDADLKRALDLRKKEFDDYTANEKELVEIIGQLERAGKILAREQRAHPASFAQIYKSNNIQNVLNSIGLVVDAAGFSVSDRQRLLTLVQTQEGEDEEDGPGAPAAAVYKSHSSGIIDILEDMQEKAEAQLVEVRKKEVETQHHHNMLTQSLKAQLAADNKDMKSQKSAKAAAEEEKATAEGNLQQTLKELKEAAVALTVARTTCMRVSGDHEKSIQAREEELKVITEAKAVLTETTSGAVDHTYTTLVQISQMHHRGRETNHVVAQLNRLAHDYHSAALAQLASRVHVILLYAGKDGDDPFAKVKDLIQDMIEQLTAQAQAEMTEKEYCDDQLAKTKVRKEELDDVLAKLTVTIDGAVSKSTELTQEVRDVQAELSDIAKSQAQMDTVRQESHAAYKQAKLELEKGLNGIRQALGLLRSYYSNSAALLQNGDSFSDLMQQPALPTSHAKATGAGQGIIGLLEVCESDFASSLAKQETQEEDSQSGYDRMTQENKVSVAVKEKDVHYKTQEIKYLKTKLAEYNSDSESATAEHAAVLEYFSKMKERCMAKPETIEERMARRSAEIAGLKEALGILENEGVFVQQKKHGNFRGALQPQ